MKVLHGKDEISALCDDWHKEGYSVSIVPTMGFLHEGHLSLIRLAQRHNDKTVVSIFVNPTQFGPNEDFHSYPRNEKHDLEMCHAEGVDAVFMPSPEEMYCGDSSVTINENRISETMCGLSRPGHFSGVLTVVLKLFNITRADSAVFGMKDAQQLACIKRMVRDLDVPVKIISAPTVREADGLAMSSRNAYLSTEERKNALCLYKALIFAENQYTVGNTSVDPVKKGMKDIILSVPDVQIDYISIVDAATFIPQEHHLEPNTLIALAVKIGKVRLIDNIILS